MQFRKLPMQAPKTAASTQQYTVRKGVRWSIAKFLLGIGFLRGGWPPTLGHPLFLYLADEG